MAYLPVVYRPKVVYLPQLTCADAAFPRDSVTISVGYDNCRMSVIRSFVSSSVGLVS